MGLFVILSQLILCISLTNAGTIRYCVPKNVASSFNVINACKRLESIQYEVQCVTATDRLSCFNLLITGKADFMVAEPEDLRVMNIYNGTDIVVTHQLKQFAETMPQRNVEMIAIVRRNFDNNWTTRKKKLCSIGLETSYINQFEYYYTTYFESWLFVRSCDPNKTLLENRISSLSEYFDSACVAGLWSLDRTIDAELKAKYKNLCALCSNPNSCEESDRYYGMNGALMCLRQEMGDVAWLDRSDVSKYFSQLAASGCTLLCPDGSFAPLVSDDDNTSCTWIVDPRPVIVANRNVAQIVLDQVSDKGDEGAKFYPVIHASYIFSYLHKLDSAVDITDYLEQFSGYFRAGVKSQPTCRATRNIRWCVTNNLESMKCRILQRAADALDLNPSFSCIQVQSRDECLQVVSNGRCDVYVAKPGDEHQLKSLGLKSIMEIMANKQDELNNVAALVKKDSKFKTYADLEGANACFTGYKSVGWNAFVQELKNVSAEWDCWDIDAISTFFKDSCVLGIDPKNHRFPKNLYSLCKNVTEQALGVEEETFKCLMDGADVAFVNASAAREYASRTTFFNMKYRMLCPTDGSRDSNSCYLAKVSLGSILVRENITKVKENDIYLMFLALDRYFGRSFDRETPMFSMYEPYDENSSVIFPDETAKLQRTVPNVQYNIYTGDFDPSDKTKRCRIIKKNNASSQPIVFVILFIPILNVMYLQS